MAGVVRASLYFDVNGKQAVQQINQVERSVADFHRSAKAGFGQTQQVAQQAVYAVDDFFAAFATGGFAGGLRGAGNNLTLIASQLGGIKVQLAAVGVLAGAQLLTKFFERSGDAATKAVGQIKDFRQQTEEFNVGVDRQRELSNIREQSREAPLLSQTQLRERAKAGRDEVNELAKQIADSEAKLFNARRLADQLLGPADVKEQARRLRFQQAHPGEIDPALGEEYGNQQMEIQKLVQELVHLKKRRDELITQHDKYVQAERAIVALEHPGHLAQPFGLFGNSRNTALGDPSQLGRNLRRARAASTAFNPFSAFGLLPSANQFGSVGAVSSINQSMTGPRNVEDAQLRKLESIDRSARDLVRKMGSKVHSLVEVPL